MKFSPHGIILSCGKAANLSLIHFFEVIPDCGLELYISSWIENAYHKFTHNKINCCIEDLAYIPAWALQHNDVTLMFQCSLDKYTIGELCRYFMKRNTRFRRRTQIQLSDCCVNEVINAPYINNLFALVPNITLLNEKADTIPMKEFVSAIHRTRRRPCRYPFEYISMDTSGNIFQCPYCNSVITKFKNYSSLLNDSKILHFLASQLILEIESYPRCSQCPYWIDGWLGDEKEYYVNTERQPFDLLWDGHICQIRLGGPK